MGQMERMRLSVFILTTGIVLSFSSVVISSSKKDVIPIPTDLNIEQIRVRSKRQTDLGKPSIFIPSQIQPIDHDYQDWSALSDYPLSGPGFDSSRPTVSDVAGQLQRFGGDDYGDKASARGPERWGDKAEDEKRKWSSGNLAMWGKRKWSANGMGMWGKRDSEKRKWNGNSLAMWGKRDLSDSEMEDEKRRWNGNSMAMWGKRNQMDSLLDEEKRRWSANGMAMWGKRDLSQFEPDVDKRKWSGSNMAMWGKKKRSMDQNTNNQNSSSGDGQRVVARGWSGSNMAMWGKRDTAKKLSR